MTDFLPIVSNTVEVTQLSTNEINKYNTHTLLAQSKLGRELVLENAKLVVAMDVMSDVIRDNKKENEELKITLEATESKLGGPLTSKELADYRNS